MADYNQIISARPRCFVCQKKVTLGGELAYMTCKNHKHYCHKKCLKDQVAQKWEDRLNSGHSTYSGGISYKKYKCSCGSLMKIHNTTKYKIKKAFQYTSPLIILIILI